MREATGAVRPHYVEGTVTDGRLTLAIAAPDPTLQVRRPGYEPLSAAQPVATLALTDDDLEVVVELTADHVATLVDALASAADREDDADD